MGTCDYAAFTAQRIASLRGQMGVSANEMSYAMDHGKNYVQTIEQQESSPSMSGFYQILDYFGITAKDFFDAEYKYPVRLQSIIEKMKFLEPEDLDGIELIIERLAAKRSCQATE